jgi:hypothetical protein
MDYSKSLMLYQDQPVYGLFLKLIISIVPVAMLGGSIYLYSTGESTGSLVLLIESVILSFIFWCVFPRKYQVYEDHLRIVLGGPFSVKIGFGQIETTRITGKQNLTVNFVTKMAKEYVEILKKQGMSIAITPGDYAMFVENANQALSQWTKQQQSRK